MIKQCNAIKVGGIRSLSLVVRDMNNTAVTNVGSKN